MKYPATLTLPAIQQAFRDLWDQVKWIVNGQLDFSGRRLQKIGNAAVADDALPLGQAKDLFMPIGQPLTQAQQAALKNTRLDVFANRGTAGAYKNQFFTATDMEYVTWVSDGTAWRWAFGVYQRTQAQLSALSSILLTTDEGFRVYISDYFHLLRWNSSAWDFAPSDPGSGFVSVGKPNGNAPNGGLWGLCDGTAYNVLNGDGSLTSLTTQNLTGGVFILGDTGVTSQVAAARATWESTAKTDNESTHTHAVGTLANSASATGVSVDAHTTASDTTVTGAATRLTGPTTHTVTDPTHTHTISGSTAAGAAHQHVLSNTNAQLKVPSEANGGLPLRISVVFYMRR